MTEQGASLEAVRRWWPLAAGVVLGLLAGLLVSLLQSGTRRAEATVLISSPSGPPAVKPLLPNLGELATSSVVAGNVRSTLRLAESTETLRRRLHATVRPGSEVIVISATDSVADHARQLAQEASAVFSQLVGSRFGAGSPELHAAVLDSAHVLAGPDRHFGRNLLIGGLVGLLLGSAATFVLASRPPRIVFVPVDDSDVQAREQLLEQRVSSVSARERAVAARAGKQTARERDLDARGRKLDAHGRELESRTAKVEASERELAARAKATPPPGPPAPAPQPQPEPGQTVRAGAWNLEELQSMVDAATGASSEQMEEWRTYLYFLRQHASHDGTLPRSLDSMINDVFADLVDRRPAS